jgi:predicted amidohydrolase
LVSRPRPRVDRKFYEASIPSAETQPLFDEAKKLGIGFYLGYAELTQENGRTRRFNTAILVGPDGTLVGKYRKIHLPGHAEHKPQAAVPAPWRRSTSKSATSAFAFGISWTRLPA